MPAFAAIDPGPLENRKEYGSKPASRAKTTLTFPPIGSVPLIPINELVNAFGAGPPTVISRGQRVPRNDIIGGIAESTKACRSMICAADVPRWGYGPRNCDFGALFFCRNDSRLVMPLEQVTFPGKSAKKSPRNCGA